MNRCEHGQKITKFCVTEHCHHKEAAGCDYCIRKYHFHLTSTVLLSEGDLEGLLKALTLPTDFKFKVRNLQETALDYLRNVKNSINTWIEQAQNAIIDRLSHPTLRANNLLNSYNRLKQKDYRKLTAKELRALNEFSKNYPAQALKKQELVGYYRQVDWAKEILAAAEKIAIEITKLPQAKEGEGSISLPTKSKLNDVLESIQREKDKRDEQNSLYSTQNNSKPQVLKPEDSTLTKRRQSQQKKESTPNKDVVKDLKDLTDRKSIDVPVKSFEPDFQEEKETVNNNLNQTSNDKVKRLKRRRSSIDDKLDLKFGAAVDEKAKEIQQRKRKLIENVIGQKKNSQQKIEKRQSSKTKLQKQPEQSIIGNLLNLKFAKIQDPKKKETKNLQSERVSIQTESAQKNQRQINKTSQNTINDQNLNRGLNFMETVINNILPPLPPSIKNSNDSSQPYFNKVVKIPMLMKQFQDEIQSPIFKSKRKHDKQNSQRPAFGLTISPVQNSDEVVQKPSETLPAVAEKPGEESSVPVLPNKFEKKKSMEEQDEPIVLQKNQKNSLLLFSQALRTPSERAVELLKAALKYCPENLSAAEYLSYLYIEAGRAKECLQICEAILSRIEDTPEEFELSLHLHNNKAAALNLLGRYSESIMILQKCLRYRRKHYFYKNLGDAYFCLGIPEKAAMNYEKAVKLDTQYDEAYYNLAVTQFIQEEYSSAQLNIGNALRIDGNNESYVQLSKQIEKRIENIGT